MLSAALPGGGQVYTGHYLKAGSFLAFEAITASVTGFWYATSRLRNQNADSFSIAAAKYKKDADIRQFFASKYRFLEDSIKTAGNQPLATLLGDSAAKYETEAVKYETMSAKYEEIAALDHFDAKSARLKMYNGLTMLVGGYIFNIYSAVGNSRFFITDSEKNPTKAAWLSAIPALGLGQIYNEAIPKAGFIMMTQVSLGVLAVNEHRLMNEAQQHLTAAIDTSYRQDWESRRSTSFRNRNQWLWYSLLFYFYGILDAVVDAHLHDYNRKIRAYPDLIPERSVLRINVDYRF